jgi:hypothetical protein
VRDNKIHFATILINTKCKKAYTWYELRFKVDKDNTGIDKIVYNRNYDALLKILLKKRHMPIKKNLNKQNYGIVQEICESIITDDELIILEDDKTKDMRKKFLLSLVDLIDPYSSEREFNIQTVKPFKEPSIDIPKAE